MQPLPLAGGAWAAVEDVRAEVEVDFEVDVEVSLEIVIDAELFV